MITCVIPHAGKKYAGDCRKNVFDWVLSVHPGRLKKVLFIAAVHDDLDQTWVYNDSNKIFRGVPSRYISTHTWEWVKDELKENFPKSEITLLFPSDNFSLTKGMLTKLNFFDLVIGTTDLIHNFENKYTWYDKISIEGNLVQNMVNNQLKDPKQFYCGRNSLRCIFQINKFYNLKGYVIDYYDSTQSIFTGIDRYTFKPPSRFVSYVGIGYNSQDSTKNLLPLNKFDKNLVLGAIVSMINDVIKHQLKNSVEFYLPKFSKLYSISEGIFVSTSDLAGSTNSCVGNYDSPKKNTAQLLFQTIQNNLQDSITRWNNPLQIGKFTPSFELLQPKKQWISIPRLLKRHKPYGIYIYSSGVTPRSATFLPVVWRNYNYTPNQILTELKNKAGIKSSDQYKIKLYKCEEYS